MHMHSCGRSAFQPTFASMFSLVVLSQSIGYLIGTRGARMVTFIQVERQFLL